VWIEDLQLLPLPERAESAAGGKPLITLSLAVLRNDPGKRRECTDGACLVSDLLREDGRDTGTIGVARLLA
jgi:hypothetical protein